MFFKLKNITLIANILLVAWVIWHLAFMQGYEDAMNDLTRRGYDFSNTKKAFR